MQNPTPLIIVGAVVALIAIILAGVYMSGALDDIIEHVGIYLFKAKAKAEEKKLEAQGLKEGEDFFKGQLKGNQQAQDVAMGFGDMKALSGIKKSL